MTSLAAALPRGVVPVLQTAFDDHGHIDEVSQARLVGDAIAAGADGLLTTAVASEVQELTTAERLRGLQLTLDVAEGRVPVVYGASATTAAESRAGALAAEEAGASAYLVAVPAVLRAHPSAVVRFFVDVAAGCGLPLMLQDLDLTGSGLSLDIVARLRDEVLTLAGIKVETVPAGPKYSALRQRFGPELHLSGGWAVMQLIEALDRGVDAMIPEASMVRVYRAIVDRHASGDRAGATGLFHRLLPVLAFTNQEITTSIAFFKRLLLRKGIFDTARTRVPLRGWDDVTERTAAELIDAYRELEGDVAAWSG